MLKTYSVEREGRDFFIVSEGAISFVLEKYCCLCEMRNSAFLNVINIPGRRFYRG
jgi:hypothetical protein